eukprot:COSAG01_NODE_253_length_20220_cov_22.308196_5_plen_339_part_00
MYVDYNIYIHCLPNVIYSNASATLHPVWSTCLSASITISTKATARGGTRSSLAAAVVVAPIAAVTEAAATAGIEAAAAAAGTVAAAAAGTEAGSFVACASGGTRSCRRRASGLCELSRPLARRRRDRVPPLAPATDEPASVPAAAAATVPAAAAAASMPAVAAAPVTAAAAVAGMVVVVAFGRPRPRRRKFVATGPSSSHLLYWTITCRRWRCRGLNPCCPFATSGRSRKTGIPPNGHTSGGSTNVSAGFPMAPPSLIVGKTFPVIATFASASALPIRRSKMDRLDGDWWSMGCHPVGCDGRVTPHRRTTDPVTGPGVGRIHAGTLGPNHAGGKAIGG